MHKLIPLLFIFSSGIFSNYLKAQENPPNDESHLKKAHTAYQAKNYGLCAKEYQLSFQQQKYDAISHYNAACCASLAGKTDQAYAWLNIAVNNYQNLSHYQSDSDLENIRADQRWSKIINKLENTQAFWHSPSLATPYQENISTKEKIAGLSKIWMEAKYNFAFFDQVPDLNWDESYLNYIDQVIATSSTQEYYQVLTKFIIQLQDGHTNVYVPEALYEKTYSRLGLRTRLIEDKVIVIDVFSPDAKENNIHIGDVISHINNMPVKAYVNKYIAQQVGVSTAQDRNVRLYEYQLFSGDIAKPLTLTIVNRKGNSYQAKLSRLSPKKYNQLRTSQTKVIEFSVIENNIGYLVLNSFGSNTFNEKFLKILPEIHKTNGLIIDIRNNGGGNSNQGWAVLKQLTSKAFKTTNWSTRSYSPTSRAWQQGQSWDVNTGSIWSATPNTVYNKPVNLLISARTFSAAEDMAVVFDAMNRGKLIGTATGGSTGQPLLFNLPGGGSARVCVKRDTYPNGKEFVGVGVLPNIHVTTTQQAIIDKKDLVLKAAIKDILTTRT